MLVKMKITAYLCTNCSNMYMYMFSLIHNLCIIIYNYKKCIIICNYKKKFYE